MTCQRFDRCGGFIGEDMKNSMAGNYLINSTTVYDGTFSVPIENLIEQKIEMGGFIGYSESSSIFNNYSINAGLPWLIGNLNPSAFSSNFWYYWYGTQPCEHDICRAGSFSMDLHSMNSSFFNIKEGSQLFAEMGPLYEIINKKVGMEFDLFSLATCSNLNIFNNASYDIPVLRGLMPNNCTVIDSP